MVRTSAVAVVGRHAVGGPAGVLLSGPGRHQGCVELVVPGPGRVVGIALAKVVCKAKFRN